MKSVEVPVPCRVLQGSIIGILLFPGLLGTIHSGLKPGRTFDRVESFGWYIVPANFQNAGLQ